MLFNVIYAQFSIRDQIKCVWKESITKRTNFQVVAPCVQNVVHLAYVLPRDEHLCDSRTVGVRAVWP